MTLIVRPEHLKRFVTGREAVADKVRPQFATSQEELEYTSFQVSLGLAKQELREKLEGAPDRGPLWIPEHPMTCLLQSFIAEHAEIARPELREEAQFDDDDIFRWAGSVIFQWWRRLKPAPFVDLPAPAVIDLPEQAQLALFGDWGVGPRYGAQVLSATISDPAKLPGPLHAVIHLGDTYYSGTPKEIQENLLDAWPRRDGARAFALNGNHEMYGGGVGYYQALAQLGQPASYFALQNSHFTIIALDTAYKEYHLHGRQADWVQEVLAQAGDRKFVLLSHHQPFSAFEDVDQTFVASLQGLLHSGRVVAWYWGHEHKCILYSPHKEWGTHGRCVGHGGYPYFLVNRKMWVKEEPMPGEEVELPAQEREAGSQWYVFPESEAAPGGLVLGDNCPELGADAENYGAQGFVTLELDGPRLIEKIRRPDGTIIYRQLLCQ